MKKNPHIIFLITILLSCSSIAQVDSVKLSSIFLKEENSEIDIQINYSLDDGNKLLNRISSFDETDLFYSSLFLAGTASSFLLDDEIRDIAYKNQTSTMNSVTKVGEIYGNGYFSLILSAALFSSGLLLNNSDLKNTGRILAEALIISGVSIQIIKIVSGRSRPFTKEGNNSFEFFEIDSPHNSFPSGHTLAAFTTSSVLAASIKNVYASIALYSMAGLTAYQRIYSDNHWFSDTVLAALIGTFAGNILARINDERFEETRENKIIFNIYPTVSPSQMGLILILNF